MRTEKIVLESGIDNIFEYSFMQDFTTVAVYLEEGGDLSHLCDSAIKKCLYRDDFYSLVKMRPYTKDELYAKFNIFEIA